MKRHARRAFTLTHLLMMLPVLAAMMGISYELLIGSARLQGRTIQSLESDAAIRDLVRRVQQDVGEARAAQFEPMEAGGRLVLTGGASRVVYEATGTRVRRIATMADDRNEAFLWSFRQVSPKFTLEAVADSPRVVWLTWDIPAERQSGPVQSRYLAAAAAVGRGGR